MSGDANSSSGIEVTPQKAVNDLKNRFEGLGGNNYRAPSPKPPQLAQLHLAPAAAALPRPRTPSGSLQSKSTSSLLGDSPPSAHSAIHNGHHLRTSSDLNTPVKRAPPPPPNRAAKLVLPGSPLLSRPVPIPGGALVSHARTATQQSVPEDEHSIISASSSYHSLRNKFSNPEAGPTRVDPFTSPPPISGVYSSDVSTSSMSTIRDLKEQHKPSIPPRRHAPPPPVSRCPSSGSSSISALQSTSPSTSSDDGSDITTDSSDSLPLASSASHRRHPSSLGSESDAQGTITAAFQPPKVPPRRAVDMPGTVVVASPPPLPTRRPTVQVDVAQPQAAPRLPCRPNVITAVLSKSPEDSPVTPSQPQAERRQLVHKLPPPPTRMIALGDRLPPVRPASPAIAEEEDDSSSEAEDEVSSKDCSPDTSRSSRRPPLLFPAATAGLNGDTAGVDPRIPAPHHSAHVVVAAPYAVVSHGHHAKVYLLPSNNGAHHHKTPPVNLDIDTRSFGLKEPPKITSAEFRYTVVGQDQGRIIWLGTKEGHIVEVDIRTGKVVGMRLSAHSHPVIAIWHRGNFMVTADGHGKVLVFDLTAPSPAEDLRLTQSNSPAKVVRISDKVEFLQLAGSLLWAASRHDIQAPGSAYRNTMIRVYDLFSPGYRVYTILTKTPTGFPTCATELDGGHVYITHEEGSVSVWSVDLMTRNEPSFVEIVKCGMSDLTSCIGVCGKLWVGLRSGVINVYDVSHRPWVLTNSWFAHAKELPVVRIQVDRTLGENHDAKYRRWIGLGVVSVGRDELVRFWDGMLGGEWIETELLKREAEFSKLRNIKMLVISWNCDSARPEELNGNPANFTLLQDILTSVDSPDIISFGLQEVIDLESRKMVAKNVFMGGNKKQLPNDGGIMAAERGLDDTVTRAYKRWYDRFVSMVKLTMPPDCPYEVSHSESMIGLFTCIFIKSKERMLLRDVSVNIVKRGMGGRYGNKGGILSRFVIEDSSICMINCHLAAGQNAVRQRNSDLASFLEQKNLFPVANEHLAYAGGGDGTMVLDHEIVILNGDLNYRIDQRRDTAISLIQKGDFEAMVNHDQLLKEMKYNRGFRLRSFSEGPLKFAPTYKYDRRSQEFDSSEKKRCPAWCDRVLWRSKVPDRVKQLHYARYEADVSDHRPISAAFEVTVKSVRHEIRQTVKEQTLLLWVEQQKKFLEAEKDFYLRMGLI